MKTAATILATLAALLIAGSGPAVAQLVVGGEVVDGVEINWSVLERLGPPPNLATLLQQGDRPAPPPQGKRNVVYRPYAAGKSAAAASDGAFHPYVPPKSAKPAKPPAEAAVPVSEPVKTPAPVQPVKAAPVKTAAAPPPPPVLPEPPPVKAKPVAATPVPAPLPPPVEIAKPADKAKGPQISLPDVPIKAEPAKVEPAKVEPAKVEVVTPPPPSQPVQIARVEPALPPTPPPVAVPVAAPVPAPLPPPVVQPAKPVSLSSAPNSVVIKKGDSLSVVFPADNSRLPDGAWNDLGALAQRMTKDEALSLQLLAYAEGDDASTSKARRLSLSRALAVRSFLMDQGVRSTRIEVRALGNKIEGDGPPDRVDLVLTSR